MACSLLDNFATAMRRYTTFENICSVGSMFMSLVAVDVFETDKTLVVRAYFFPS